MRTKLRLLLLAWLGYCGLVFASENEMKEQKTIGVIGGVSWESTLLYYKLMNEAVREQLGSLNSARILLYSLNYEPIVRLEQEDRWEEVGQYLASVAKHLQDGGADYVLLACNTLHKVAPAIESAIEIPFLHIADAAGKAIASQKITKVGLLGTQFTMEDGFYASRLEQKFGLEVLIPDLSDRKRLDQIIYEELCQGKILAPSKQELLHIIHRLQRTGAQAVLLGCTELGMLVQTGDVEIPVYDTTLLHTEEAVRQSLNVRQLKAVSHDR